MPGEYGAPMKIVPTSAGDYLEVMSKSIFQTGISWRVVESKWPGTREAFHDFDAKTVAGLGDLDIEELAQDTRVIRNRKKLQAIVGNARRMLELEAEHGSFKNYLRSHGDFDATLAALRKEFKFLGPTGIYHFLYVVGENVPPYEDFEASRGK